MSPPILVRGWRLLLASHPPSFLLQPATSCYRCLRCTGQQEPRVKGWREELSCPLPPSFLRLEKAASGGGRRVPCPGTACSLPELGLCFRPMFPDCDCFCTGGSYRGTRGPRAAELKGLPPYWYSAFRVRNCARNSGKVVHGGPTP